MHISDKMKNGTATLQEIFNKEWEYFVVKKHPKCEKDGMCLYRDARGNKCAVGLLVKSKEHKKRWDNKITSGSDVLTELGWDQEYGTFINDLQELHDNCSDSGFTQEITGKLKQFAVENNLTIPA